MNSEVIAKISEKLNIALDYINVENAKVLYEKLIQQSIVQNWIWFGTSVIFSILGLILTFRFKKISEDDEADYDIQVGA